MKKCENCFNKSQILDFEFNCVKQKSCIFSTYDHRLAELFFEHFREKISEEKLKQLSNKIEESCVNLRQEIEHLDDYTFPGNSSQFITILKHLNFSIFSKTNIRLFGEFRMGDIYFDSNVHELKGSDPDKIEINLKILYEDYLKHFNFASPDKENFLRICAIFLENFFRIHPFPDGNGRVARFFLIIMALKTKNFIFERFDSMHGQDDKAYIQALRYAHKYYNHLNHKKRGTAHKKLIDWLNSKLSDQAGFTGEEEPPK